MRTLAVLTVRNEAAFLLEWLAHHKAVGFTDILVFSNDCDDPTTQMLDRLDALGHLTHEENTGPFDKGGIQFTAMKRADKHPLTKGADWILALDIDEFVNIHAGKGQIADLLAALPDADAITLTWRLFGNADQVRYQGERVTDRFTRAAPTVMHWPWRASMFKTLFRNSGTYRKIGIHRPRSIKDDDALEQYRWFDCVGRELMGDFKTKRVFSNYGQDNYQLAQLNHYPLGAMESYILKADRGRAVHSEDLLDIDYWVERNFNTAEDTSIARYRPARDAILDMLLEDRKLRKLHDSAVQWRKDRFMELMRQEPYRALFGRLMMTPPSRPISEVTGRTLAGFATLGRRGTPVTPVERKPKPDAPSGQD
ncbi:glycosyltransferase family 2 protein [Phormidium sp. CCY1219]|nr:glycosyltransferase family 2 protein [Phormidium sp. CCY1219]MEB3831187.1 glycosyltransferase family 2 protein [Phormidium sp. CCY1219]